MMRRDFIRSLLYWVPTALVPNKVVKGERPDLEVPAEVPSWASLWPTASAAENTQVLQNAIDEGGGLRLNGEWPISGGLVAQDIQDLTIIFEPGAKLVPQDGWPENQAVLVLAGADRCTIENLTIQSGAVVAAGLAIGRGHVYTGGDVTIRDASIDVFPSVATVYNAAGEVFKADNCDFISQTAQPAYYGSDKDSYSLIGSGSYPNSNSRFTFEDCRFKNYSNQPAQTAVVLDGNTHETYFERCYFYIGEGYVFQLKGDSSINNAHWNKCRVEGQNHAGSRFIHHGATAGMSRSSVVDLSYNIQSDFIIELATGSTGCKFRFVDKGAAAAVALLTSGGHYRNEWHVTQDHMIHKASQANMGADVIFAEQYWANNPVLELP